MSVTEPTLFNQTNETNIMKAKICKGAGILSSAFFCVAMIGVIANISEAIIIGLGYFVLMGIVSLCE